MNLFCFKKIIQQIYLSTPVQMHIYDMVIGLIYVFWYPHFRIYIIRAKSILRKGKGGGPSRSFIRRATLGETPLPASGELWKGAAAVSLNIDGFAGTVIKAPERALELMQTPHRVTRSPREPRQGCAERTAATTSTPAPPGPSCPAPTWRAPACLHPCAGQRPEM